jgi:4-hydroxybenzoyl-CoA reductase subunit beta
MGTLGGNLCLDTRCGYYNQTEFWRGALGGCIKTGGPVCHVVPHGKRCVAAFSADTPIPLLALGASVDLASVRGVRSLPLASFYAGDGLRNVVLAPDELVLRVHVPAPVPGSVSAFVKLRLRRAIDFPLLSMAAVTTRRDDGRFDGVSLVVGALGSLPRRVQGLDREGRPVLLDDVADAASAQCRPLSNADSPAWRKEVIGPLVRRLLSSLPR